MSKESKEQLEFTVIMPALNEEKNIQAAICSTLRTLNDFNINGDFHKISITEINEVDKTAVFIFESDSILILLEQSKPTLLNYDNDGYNDLEITLTNIYGLSLVQIILKTIQILLKN